MRSASDDRSLGATLKSLDLILGTVETIERFHTVELREKTCILKRSDCDMEKGFKGHCSHRDIT